MGASIETETEYQVAIALIEGFIKKGFAKLTEAETSKLEEVSFLVSTYEKKHCLV